MLHMESTIAQTVGEWITSKHIVLPKTLSNKSFVFGKYFGLGDEKTTNLIQRLGDFDDAFYQNSGRSCEIPEAIRYINLPEFHVRSFAEIVENVNGEKLRIPIKAVGWLKNCQLTGREKGDLLTDGQPNLFVCRSRADNRLRLVRLHLNKGWRISSERYDEQHMITGPCRIFVACRDI